MIYLIIKKFSNSSSVGSSLLSNLNLSIHLEWTYLAELTLTIASFILNLILQLGHFNLYGLSTFLVSNLLLQIVSISGLVNYLTPRILAKFLRYKYQYIKKNLRFFNETRTILEYIFLLKEQYLLRRACK